MSCISNIYLDKLVFLNSFVFIEIIYTGLVKMHSKLSRRISFYKIKKSKINVIFATKNKDI